MDSLIFYAFLLSLCFHLSIFLIDKNLVFLLDHNTDMHRENMKKKRREIEQASMDAASDLLDTDSNATFAMVIRSVKLNRRLALKWYLYLCIFSFMPRSETIGSSSGRSIGIGKITAMWSAYGTTKKTTLLPHMAIQGEFFLSLYLSCLLHLLPSENLPWRKLIWIICRNIMKATVD